MRDLKDRSTSWLLDKHPAALLFAAGERQVGACRSLRNTLTAPKRIPDGLLEVRRAGRSETDLFVVELSTYPDRRVPRQLLEDLAARGRGVNQGP